MSVGCIDNRATTCTLQRGFVSSLLNTAHPSYLRRTEHEWLQYRSENKALLDEIAVLQAREAVLAGEMRLAQGAAEAARVELRGVLAVQAARDVELASARHGFETDEILVVRRGGG